MNKRTILAGVVAGLAMYLWTSIAHMALPLGEAGISQISNEQALLASMQSTLPAHGLYMFPKMTPGTTMDQYQQQIASGPSGLLIYFPNRNFSFGKLLSVEFVSELLQAVIAVYLLSLTRLTTFGGRLGFFALLGLIAAITTNVSYWNWYGFPATYTAAYMFTAWMAYVCAGLVAAVMKVGGAQYASDRSLAMAR